VLAAGGDRGLVMVWDVNTWAGRGAARHDDAIAGLAFSPDGGQLGVAGKDRHTRVVDVASGGVLVDMRGDASALDVAFSRDGRLVATGWGDGSVRVHDVASGSERLLSGHVSFVSRVQFAPRGDLLASLGADNDILLWDLRTGSRRALAGHTERLWNAVFLKGGTHLVTSSFDDTLRLWDLATGHHVELMHLKDARSLAVAQDGVTVVAGAGGGRVVVWTDEFPTEPAAIAARLDTMTDLTVPKAQP
jgi:WD40 repeat protein